MARFKPVDSDDPWDMGSLDDVRTSDLYHGRLSGKHPSSRFNDVESPWGDQLTSDLSTTQGKRVVAPVANLTEFEAISIFEDPTDEVPFGSAPPSPITVVPTSTIDHNRPRTIAAGYSSKTKIMTVVFRDGTWWNYFGVPTTVWNNFKAAYSKGRFLYAHGFDDRYGGAPTKYQGTTASTDLLSTQEMEMLSIRARAVQKYTGGLQPGQTTAGQKRAIKRGYQQGNIGGTARKRRRTS